MTPDTSFSREGACQSSAQKIRVDGTEKTRIDVFPTLFGACIDRLGAVPVNNNINNTRYKKEGLFVGDEINKKISIYRKSNKPFTTTITPLQPESLKKTLDDDISTRLKSTE